MQIFMHR